MVVAVAVVEVVGTLTRLRKGFNERVQGLCTGNIVKYRINISHEQMLIIRQALNLGLI